MLTQRSLLIMAFSAALLPALGLAALLWQRFYRDHEGNTARRVLKNSAVPTAMRMLVRALDLAFALVLYDVLGSTDIGTYELAALLIVSYLGTFTDFGLGVLLTREVAKDNEAAPRLFGITLTLRLVLVAVAMLLAGGVIGAYQLAGSWQLGESISPLGQQAIWILTLTLIPSAFSNAVTALFNANERMEIPAALELVTAVLSNLARIMVLALGFGILGLAWAAVGVSSIMAVVFALLQARTFFAPRLVWERAAVLALVPVALPLMLNNLLNAFFFRFDMFIIKAFGAGNGDTLVAQYNQANKVTSIALIIPSVVTFAVFPVLARRGGQGRAALAEAQNRTLQVLLLIALPVTMGISVLAPDLIRLLGGRQAAQYLPISANVLALIAWFLPLSFVNGLLQYVLIAIDRQRLITRAFVVGALFNFVVNILLIPFFGLYAAAAVTICSEVVLFLMFWPLLRREELAPPLLKLAWRPTVGALVMGAAMFGAMQIMSAGWQWLGAGLVAPFAYFGALSLLGTFGSEERALLRRMFGRAS